MPYFVKRKPRLGQIKGRLARCGLELNGEKTRVVYCKDGRRRKDYPNCAFDFLGFTFRSRKARNRKGGYFTGFLPAVSNKAAKEMRRVIRRWRLHRRTDKSLEDLAEGINPVVNGWINYYGSYYKSALYPIFLHLDRYLARWAARKFKRLKGHPGGRGTG